MQLTPAHICSLPLRAQQELADARGALEGQKGAAAAALQQERERAESAERALQLRVQQLSSKLATSQVKVTGGGWLVKLFD